MASALTAKLVSLGIVWIVSLLLGGLPYFILKRRLNKQGFGQRGDFILSIFNAFSGGVFLGTCLLHLMVEGREELEEAFDKYSLEGVTYPVFEVLVAGGFFAIVFVDFLAELCLHDSTSIVLEDGKNKSANGMGPNGEINVAYQASSENVTDRRHAYGSITDTQSKHQIHTGTPSNARGITLTNHMFLGDNNANKVQPSNTTNQGTTVESTNIATVHNQEIHSTHGHVHDNNGHPHGHEFDQLAKTSTVRAVILLIALSFHTIFDGLAIGLQEFEKDVWQVLAAISVHKALVSFCLGLQLFKAYEQRLRTAAILVVLFTFISPIGISIGIVVTSANIDEDAQTMASAVLQGIASGTFLYVTFFEILKEAFSHGKGIWNILVACVGFAAMAAVKLMDSD